MTCFPTPSDTRRLIPVSEAAKLAGISENTLYRWIRSAQAEGSALAHTVVDLLGHRLRVRAAAFQRWLDGQEGQSLQQV